jgi:hypothetical protein
MRNVVIAIELIPAVLIISWLVFALYGLFFVGPTDGR